MIDKNSCEYRERNTIEWVNMMFIKDIRLVNAITSSRDLIAKCLNCDCFKECEATADNVRFLDANIDNEWNKRRS